MFIQKLPSVRLFQSWYYAFPDGQYISRGVRSHLSRCVQLWQFCKGQPVEGRPVVAAGSLSRLMNSPYIHCISRQIFRHDSKYAHYARGSALMHDNLSLRNAEALIVTSCRAADTRTGKPDRQCLDERRGVDPFCGIASSELSLQKRGGPLYARLNDCGCP
jgi:hypothetical protein